MCAVASASTPRRVRDRRGERIEARRRPASRRSRGERSSSARLASSTRNIRSQSSGTVGWHDRRADAVLDLVVVEASLDEADERRAEGRLTRPDPLQRDAVAVEHGGRRQRRDPGRRAVDVQHRATRSGCCRARASIRSASIEVTRPRRTMPSIRRSSAISASLRIAQWYASGVTVGSMRASSPDASRSLEHVVDGIGQCDGLDLIGDALAEPGERRRRWAGSCRVAAPRSRAARSSGSAPASAPLSSSQMQASIPVLPAPITTNSSYVVSDPGQVVQREHRRRRTRRRTTAGSSTAPASSSGSRRRSGSASTLDPIHPTAAR